MLRLPHALTSCSHEDSLIALGFDGSFTDDATALVGCDIRTGHLFVIKAWEKPDGPEAKDWEVPREDVDGTVDWAFAEYDVCAFFADVHPFESYVDAGQSDIVTA
jgi:hypothetical protein